jgi:hypothetical protein
MSHVIRRGVATVDRMTRLVSLLRDALRQDADSEREPDVHFHAIGGMPQVCHEERCARPQLLVR